jgi:hypothetical protein
VPISDSCTAAKAPYGITSSARARNAAHRLSGEAAPAGFLDAHVEELARIIASNALIAMRGMKYAQ